MMTVPFEIPPAPPAGASPSPFTPTFGTVPPILADRQPIINEFARAIDHGPGATGRATLVTGQRGVGKTVMLNVFRQVAESRQWLTIRSTATPGFLEVLTETKLPAAMHQLDSANVSRTSITGVTLPGIGGGVTTKTVDQSPIKPNFEYQLMRTLEVLQKHETGLVITVDEIHRSQLPEFRQFADAAQAANEGRAPLAIAAAGLPETMKDLAEDVQSTFVKRADRVILGNLSEAGTRYGLQAPLRASGKEIGAEALSLAVQESDSYPYLVQLIGDNMWVAAGSSTIITVDHVHEAAARAAEKMFQQIHEPTVTALPAREREYVVAMSQDDGPSSTSTIASRMGINVNHAGIYRERLIARGVIEPASRGQVTFTIPYTADYLRASTNTL